jgi:O-antigen/teichoic acid export membrane protein
MAAAGRYGLFLAGSAPRLPACAGLLVGPDIGRLGKARAVYRMPQRAGAAQYGEADMNAWWTRYLPAIMREFLGGRIVLQKTIGNTGWLLVDKVLRMIIGLTVGAWVARYLGPAQFGVLAYVMSFIAFFMVIANLQTDGFIVRDIAQDPENAPVILGTALWLRTTFGVVSWGVAIVFMFLLHPEDSNLILLTAIVGATLVFQASDTVDLWFQSQSQSKKTVIAKLVSYLLSNGVKVALLIFKAPLAAFAGVMAFECAILTLSLATVYRRFPTTAPWRTGLTQSKKILSQCWPFVVSGFLMTTFSRVDQIMLKELLGEQQLGIYAAAIPLSHAWTVIPATLVTSIGPFVARRKLQSEQLYQKALVSVFRFFALLSILSTLLTVLLSKTLIKIIYGSQYQSAATILSIYVFSNLFTFQGFAQSLWVINNNVRGVTLFATSISALICIISNMFMIKNFGTIGAAYSILIVELVSIVLIPCLFRRDLINLYTMAFIPFCKLLR